MQLNAALAPRRTAVRSRLGAAACMLLAAGVPVAARAEDATPGTQVDASALYYGENQRVNVAEPEVRVTHLFSNGQSVAAQFGLDVITGASATGGTPSGQVQTTTSASGTETTVQADAIPTIMFRDNRASGDLDWTVPVGALFSATASLHVSTEKDYQSLGANATFSLDVLHRMVTLTGGAGVNRDHVDPVGGTVVGLSDGGSLLTTDPDRKNVSSVMAGLTRVVTRRWLVGVSGTREVETGYLTEPYKVLSVLDPATGFPVSSLHEKRPGLRTRSSVLGSSVFHLTDDVVYTNYRYYWDDWGVRSHTIDFRYRYELPNQAFLQPHVRVYTQSQAEFFRYFLVQAEPLPDFASSDNRIGPLRSLTLGATYGFHIPNTPGEWGVRAEYVRQWGNGHPADAPGVQHDYDLFPGLDVGSLLVTYSVGF